MFLIFMSRKVDSVHILPTFGVDRKVTVYLGLGLGVAVGLGEGEGVVVGTGSMFLDTFVGWLNVHAERKRAQTKGIVNFVLSTK